jgi:hypothetical protein
MGLPDTVDLDLDTLVLKGATCLQEAVRVQAAMLATGGEFLVARHSNRAAVRSNDWPVAYI